MKGKFKVTNTTVKAPRIINGVDERRAVEKVGHPVVVFGENQHQHIIQAGQSVILDNIDNGTLKMIQAGFLRCDKIGDVADILKQYVVGPEKKQPKRKAKVHQIGMPEQAPEVSYDVAPQGVKGGKRSTVTKNGKGEKVS